jgi:hypothetical protein
VSKHPCQGRAASRACMLERAASRGSCQQHTAQRTCSVMTSLRGHCSSVPPPLT